MADVTTTIVVDFKSASENDIFTAEIDSRSEGLNNGKTSFEPGDSPGILVHKSVGVSVTSVATSAGTISNLGVQSYTHEETVQFANERTAKLAYPASAIVSQKWLGNNLGVAALQGDSGLIVPTKGVGVLKIEYTVNPVGYRLSGVPHPLNGETEYSVLVHFEGQGNG